MCRRAFAVVLASALFLLFLSPARAQFTQQGPKFVGAGAVGSAEQGRSVSFSADGNTLLVGGPHDNGQAGAAWVWTRSGGVWTQQGPKLVGSDAVGKAFQGCSVSLSADGNTALVGGLYDDSYAGAAWVWTRSGGAWTQQGPKLVGSDAVGTALQGISVSLSADGNTAIAGGAGDNSHAGAAWVWTRSGGVWTQQGPKLVGSGAAGDAALGPVSLSADGNTAIVGGAADNNNAGAAWVWTRSGGVWTQQGPKLIGSGATGNAIQGCKVSLSADGNTALVGGAYDDSYAGAAWVWTRSGGVWTQQGAKLVGSGAMGNAEQGLSVSLSGDGNTAITGGFGDNSDAGAVWVWTRSGGVWTQQGAKLVGSGAVGNAYQGYSVSLSADGHTAIVGGPWDNGTAGAAWVFIDDGGCSLSCTAAATPFSGQAPLNVNFSATATASYCTDLPTFSWSFGDGTSSTEQNPSKVYSSAGTYTWSLTVTADGQACSQSGTIIVSVPCSLSCTATVPATGTAGSAVAFSSTATPSNCAGTPTFDWNFGDGTAHATSQNPSQTYGSAGTFNWSLTVAVNGVTCQRSGSIIVSNSVAPPVISLIKKASPPFKLVVTGSNLQSGIKVYISGTQWPSVIWKNTGKIQLTGAIKAAVPKGTTKAFRFVNPDGGEVTMTWGW